MIAHSKSTRIGSSGSTGGNRDSNSPGDEPLEVLDQEELALFGSENKTALFGSENNTVTFLDEKDNVNDVDIDIDAEMGLTTTRRTESSRFVEEDNSSERKVTDTNVPLVDDTERAIDSNEATMRRMMLSRVSWIASYMTNKNSTRSDPATGNTGTSTKTLTGDIFWIGDDEDESLKQNSSIFFTESIPSWSKQDRFKRALVIPKRTQEIFGSSLFLGLLYFMVYLIPQIFRDMSEVSIYITVVFIFLQTLVTILSAIPSEDCTNRDVNLRVNASILIAMTLYPCLGLWMVTRPTNINFWDFFLNDINNLWVLKHEVFASYQWGQIFPFFFWSTSACILLRESNFAFTLDREGVVSDKDGKAKTAFFRRVPSPIEKWTHTITRYLTSSLWSILPTKHRPAG